MSQQEPACSVVAVRPNGERVLISNGLPREAAERVLAIIDADPDIWEFSDARIESECEHAPRS